MKRRIKRLVTAAAGVALGTLALGALAPTAGAAASGHDRCVVSDSGPEVFALTRGVQGGFDGVGVVAINTARGEFSDGGGMAVGAAGSLDEPSPSGVAVVAERVDAENPALVATAATATNAAAMGQVCEVDEWASATGDTAHHPGAIRVRHHANGGASSGRRA